MKEIIDAWNRPESVQEIHPTRNISEDDYWASGEAQADALGLLLHELGDAPIVDFGCGDGRVAIPLANKGYFVVPVDASENMLKELNKNLAELSLDGLRFENYFVSNGTDLKEVLGSIQPAAIYALAILIHHNWEDGKAIIRGLADALKPGGLLILDWPIADNPQERQSWVGVTTWSKEKQDEFLIELGLKRVDGAGMEGVPSVAVFTKQALIDGNDESDASSNS